MSGNVYVPDACQSESCKVHFSLNHCGGPGYAQSYDGLRDLAATNKIIVVYPESNCWNSGEDISQDAGVYLTNQAVYPKFLKAVMCRVLNENEDSSDCPNEASGLASIALALIASIWLVQ